MRSAASLFAPTLMPSIPCALRRPRARQRGGEPAVVEPHPVDHRAVLGQPEQPRACGLPACGSGVSVPISTLPKPSPKNPAIARPSLSAPAASPSGLGKVSPATGHRQRRRPRGQRRARSRPTRRACRSSARARARRRARTATGAGQSVIPRANDRTQRRIRPIRLGKSVHRQTCDPKGLGGVLSLDGPVSLGRPGRFSMVGLD